MSATEFNLDFKLVQLQLLRNVKNTSVKVELKMATTGNFALLGFAELVSCSTGNVSTGVRQSTSGRN